MNELLNWTQLIANVATALGIIGFAFFYFTHQQNQRQFMFTVMLSCIERFQRLFPIIRDDSEDLERVKKYIDLTNEEFFYFQRKYVPREVMIEWMDSIIEMVPIYSDGSDQPINVDSRLIRLVHENRLLDGYPRLKNAFSLKKMDHSRKSNVIKAICANLGIKVTRSHFERAHVSFD